MWCLFMSLNPVNRDYFTQPWSLYSKFISNLFNALMDSLLKNNVTNSLHPYLIRKSPLPNINIQEINDLQNMYFHAGFDQETRRPDVFRKSLLKWFAQWEKQNIHIVYQFIKKVQWNTYLQLTDLPSSTMTTSWIFVSFSLKTKEWCISHENSLSQQFCMQKCSRSIIDKIDTSIYLLISFQIYIRKKKTAI